MVGKPNEELLDTIYGAVIQPQRWSEVRATRPTGRVARYFRTPTKQPDQ
jgi:hypothetical protein